MDTYWVKSKKTGEAASQTMLNPFQRQKISDKQSLKSLKPSTSPILSRPSSPLSMLPSHLSPSVERNGGQLKSPKPDEWPIADHRLSQSSEERRRGEDDRRYTLPAIQCPSIVIQRQLAGPGGGGGLPLADTRSLLDRRNTITTMDPREVQQAVIHSHPPGRPSVSSANPIWPVWNDAPPMSPRESVTETPRLTLPSGLSEYNLMTVRNSLTQHLPPLIERGVANPAQLSLFAALAEETACQARRVADWAACIARAKTSSSGNDSSDQMSSDIGSPVDNIIEGPKMCPLAQRRTNRYMEELGEGSDTVFENLNGMCPIRHEVIEESDQSQSQTKHHSDTSQSICSIM